LSEAEKALRQALTPVDAMAAYRDAVEKGIRDGLSHWPDKPEYQLILARQTALREFARIMGWEVGLYS
jgi:hypothetical protein